MISLLCLHAGARLGEMVQPLIDDANKIDGGAAIRIREGEGKSLKTAASEGVVPIHAQLVDLGFLRLASGVSWPVPSASSRSL